MAGWTIGWATAWSACMGTLFEGCAALLCTAPAMTARDMPVPAIPALADAADDDTAEA